MTNYATYMKKLDMTCKGEARHVLSSHVSVNALTDIFTMTSYVT